MNLTNTARQNLERYFGADFASNELAQKTIIKIFE